MKDMKKKQTFQPEWRTTPPLPQSFRSIFKWGAPDGFKHPNPGLYRLLKSTFGLNDNDFRSKVNEGDGKVSLGPVADAELVKTLVDNNVKLSFEKEDASPFWSSAARIARRLPSSFRRCAGRWTAPTCA